ncbi:hypothetical protein GCM10007978_09180 [Shewanella hanedai]|uniref:Uncharacterized protein n=1 Tax=Shewanella hanedai TaxID=25 RepID=A0A553JS88_SHEHA|nr:hypothetical protein [Shewanella hanedai]TRY15241.1 hypothetical protein FN961_06105 [Shewanella hanedai]GGI73599.1 hypothetical protein GCM10007978_09180 [Shewanella hanedai]
MSFKVLSIPILALLSACTASTSFQSTDPDVTLHVNKTAAISLSEPSEHTYTATKAEIERAQLYFDHKS